MNDKLDFPYFYDHQQRHWLRDINKPERITFCQIAETTLELFALAVCLLAVIVLFLCG